MPVTTKKLKDIVRKSTSRNSDLIFNEPQGINIDKRFMPSVANINGVDLSKYKVVQTGQFACNRMHVGRDERLPIAINHKKPIIVSPAYDVFEVIDSDVLPEYLMMYFKSNSFDKECWFYTDADIRGALIADSFYDISIPILDIKTQKTIVNQYDLINQRINLLQKLIEKINNLAMVEFQNLYKNTLEKDERTIDDIAQIYSGYAFKSGEFVEDGAYGLITIKNVQNDGFISNCSDRINPSNKVPKYIYLNDGDLLLSLTGNVGRTAQVIGNNYVLNQRVAKIECKKRLYKSFVQCLFSSNAFRLEMESMSSGTAQQNLSPIKIKQMKIRVPNERLLAAFSEKVDVLLSMKHDYEKEKIILTTALNTLFTSKYLSKEES